MNEKEVRSILEFLVDDVMSDRGTDKEIINKALASLDTLFPSEPKDNIKQHYDEFLGYYYNSPCAGCKDGHPSFWKTIIESTAWGAWKNKNPMSYDFAECEEVGIMSKQHWIAFLEFIKEQALSSLKARMEVGGIGKILVDVYGCKKDGEDCTHKKCNRYFLCEALSTAIVRHLKEEGV